MKPARAFLLSASRFLLPVLLSCCAFGAPKFDIPPPTARQPTVLLAQKLSHPSLPSSLPADIKAPFNPPGFEQPDPEEEKAKAAANAIAAAEPRRPRNDKEILAVIAEGIHPSGTFVMGGEPILLISKKKFKVGDRLSISFDDRDFEVEITAIDRSSFSLRLNRAELTRPIKPGKTP